MAEIKQGPGWSSYDLSADHKLNIDELIYILSPQDLPLTLGINADGVPLIPRLPVDNREFYWMEEEVPLPRSTINEALDTSETDVTVATGTGVNFVVGDTVRVGNEFMVVTAVNVSTDVLTVTRGALGSTAAVATSGAEILGVGTTLPEGQIGSTSYRGRDRYSNYTQIFTRKMRVTRTEQRIPKYGVPNELNKQMLNTMQALNLGIEQAATYGRKYNDNATETRSTGGLAFYNNVNVSSDTWLTIRGIELMQEAAYNKGGMFTVISGQPAHFRHLNNIAGDSRIQTVTVDDARRGRARATVVMTEFGDVTLVRNRWNRKTDAFGFNPENFVMRQFQPMVTQPLAKVDDADNYMMVTELGFQVKGADHMAAWTSLDLTAALPTEGS